MSKRTHTIFWREYDVINQHLAKVSIIEYRMYKAVNKNTLRRLHGQGWSFEAGTAGDDAYLRTEEECRHELYRLRARQIVEVDDIIKKLQAAKLEVLPVLEEEDRSKSTTRSLLLKPMGRGH